MFDLLPFNRDKKKVNSLLGEFDFLESRSNLFNDFMDLTAISFKTDIKETEDNYILEVELPGLKREDITIETEDEYLTIKVKQNQELEEEKEDYIYRERRVGSHQRSFRLNNVNIDEIEAEYDNGVLNVTLPKEEKRESNKRIIDVK